MATLQDIQFHYDVGNDFFDLFLDRQYKIYSCAVWETADTLELAQAKKLDRIASFAKVKSGGSVLDVGCGWGGMMRYLLEEYHAGKVVGLTLSEEQFHFVEALNLRSAEVQVCSWSDFHTDEKFDSIVSIGAFEHFASLNDKANGTHTQVYESFFRQCHRLSCEKSSLGLQTIVLNRSPSSLQEIRDTRFLLREVFPGSALPRIDDIQVSMSSFYEVSEMLTIGQDYAKTLSEWKERLCQHEEYAVKQYGDKLFNHYLNYFDAARRDFENEIVGLAQFSLKRKDC